MTQRFDGAEIARATGGVLHGNAGAAGPVSTDTRADLGGAWFVALRGARFDAHDFAAQAREGGAAGGVFERPVAGWRGRWVQVPDTTRALQDLGRAARARLAARGVPVVGVSGCSGKTTTRELVACALSPRGPVHRTRANDNNHLGVPLTLLATPDAARAVVVELGSSGPGEMAVVADVALPDVRLCVNIGAAHLEALGDLAAVSAEEGAVLDRARGSDVCLLNADDPWLADRDVPGRVLRFGTRADADVRLVAAEVDVDGWTTDATYATPAGTVRARLPVPGAHVAHDAAAALAAAFALGVDVHAAAAELSGYVPVGGRLRREVLPDGLVVIDDAYNANPASVAAALSLVAGSRGPVAVVLGDMLELGAAAPRYHREVLARAATAGFAAVVAVGPAMHAAAPAGVARVSDPADAARHVRAALGGRGTVLVKGSRGMRLERVIDALRAGDGRR